MPHPRDKPKTKHVVPETCAGPWFVVTVINEILVVWECKLCGTQWMVLRPDTKKPIA